MSASSAAAATASPTRCPFHKFAASHAGERL